LVIKKNDKNMTHLGRQISEIWAVGEVRVGLAVLILVICLEMLTVARLKGFEFDLGDLFGNFGGGKKSSRKQPIYDEFEEESLDMEQIVELPIWDFLLGTKISIDSPYSGKFKVTVPECTKPGTRLKVTGKGRTSGKKAGDLYLKLDARMPNKLTEKQRDALEKIN
jgi:hypothetical protein